MSGSSHYQQVWSQLGAGCSSVAESVISYRFFVNWSLCYGFQFLFHNSREHFSLFVWFFFFFFFFPTTAQWVISSVLFSRFWLLHSAVVITEFHVAFSFQSMWGYCISNSKEDTSRGRTVLDILNLKRRAPDSHFSFPRSAILPSQSSHPWPTKKLPLNSPSELYLFFHISSLDSSWAQCINKRLIHTFTLKPSKDPKAYESS